MPSAEHDSSTPTPDLLAAYWTLAGPLDPRTEDTASRWPFADRVAAAADVGYRGFGIRRTDLTVLRESLGLGEIRRILDDFGMRHLELEVLIDWFTDDARRPVSDVRCDELFSAAESLDARHLKASGSRDGAPVPFDTYVAEFQRICRRAADTGAMIVLEPNPMTGIRTAAEGLKIVEAADMPNGTLAIDIWHVERAGTSFADIAAIDAGKIGLVELNDAPDGPVTWDETLMHRTECGAGSFDIAGFVAAIQQTGYDGPIGVEIIGEDHRERDLQTAARISFDTTMTFVQ